MSMKRPYGGIQPGIKIGMFTIRIPGIHYRIEMVEAIEAIIMCAACLSAIPVMTQILEIPSELAWSMVIINGILYNCHSFFGDPVIPGWITPSVPITTAYLMSYTNVTERIQALIAVQIMLTLIFLILGGTGLAKKIVTAVPATIKGGILLGAGFSAVYGEFTGRVNTYPITICAATIVLYFLLFSKRYGALREKHKIFDIIGNMGMVIAFALAILLGPVVGEIQWPDLVMGTVIKLPDVSGILKTVTLFGVGFPPAHLFIKGFATALVIYIIAFSDFITADVLISDATEVRPDEVVDLDANRSNIVCAIRNGVESIFCPYPTTSGPMWSAAYAITVGRYKTGRDKMDSIWSGCGTFRWFTMIGVMLYPVYSLLLPMLPIALSLSMMIQGYICVSLAMQFCKTDMERGIAGSMGAVLAAKGSIWGLIVGILLYLFLNNKEGVRKEIEESKRESAELEERARKAKEAAALASHHPKQV